MRNRNIAAALTITGLLAANSASALPATDAPQSRVNACVETVAENADYTQASRVRHEVETEGTGVSRYRMSIHTLVIGDDGSEVIRAYSASCLVGSDDEVQRFKIRQTDI